jgi:sigma-E factor negative regulatory protein RseC
MTSGMIEHWGMVRRIDDGRATVIVETTACSVCGHCGHCCICKSADGALATMLDLPAVHGLKEGDFVNVGLSESGLSFAALLGYLFPVLATLVGTLAGVLTGGGDSAMALGAAAGFVASLVVARIAIAYTPGLSPSPQLIPVFNQSNPFSKE